jgi:predicted esterase
MIPRVLTALVACLLLCPAALRAQGSDEIGELNQKAIDALQEKKFDEGIAIFKQILEKTPKDRGTAYNLACASSLKGDIDGGFEWLGRAIDWGWGSGTGTLVGGNGESTHVEMTRADPDLENLRKDKRFAPLMERMEALAKKFAAYTATAAVYIPERVAKLDEMPLLVVLHDVRSTKERVVEGRWKAIADELGTALVAPSGKVALGSAPSDGMAWFDDARAFRASPGTFEKPVGEAVAAFKKEHKVDKSRVFIAGEGFGCTLALDIAVGSPGLYRGAVGVDGTLLTDLMSRNGPNAGKAGLKLRLFLDTARAKLTLPPNQDVEKLVQTWNQSLQAWGIAGGVSTVTPDAKDPKQVDKLIVDALKGFAPSAAAIEAGASK